MSGRHANIRVGYEIGTGEEISVPLRHMAVTGQTQMSGKTTTLEALVTRSAATALTFVTKRGESSFVGGRRVAPYFRDRADWQFVTSIIDATLQEKNKFLRPWIMRICRNTHTLAEVQEQVRDALRTAKGINEGVYTQLDAYLDLIVPEIERADLADTLDLAPGLNVMDVSSFATPMQMLFLQSALDWVNERSRDTIIVVPEAWEFVPEGKSSPVKASAIALVRKGAGIGNHIWVDSQDMAGVDKTILRGCTVWLIGVQREANEIKRTLANIPEGIGKPKAADVATLERGEFFACFGKEVHRVYVQPVWVSENDARTIATGQAVPQERPREEKKVMAYDEEKAKLQRENLALRQKNEALEHEIADLKEQLQAPQSGAMQPRGPASDSLDNESLFQAFKKRLIEELPSDPRVMQIVVSKPELRVAVKTAVIEVDGASLRGQLGRLIADGFFDSGATGNAAFNEMQARKVSAAKPTVYSELDKLTAMGFLRKGAEFGYRAVEGMKVKIVEAT